MCMVGLAKMYYSGTTNALADTYTHYSPLGAGITVYVHMYLHNGIYNCGGMINDIFIVKRTKCHQLRNLIREYCSTMSAISHNNTFIIHIGIQRITKRCFKS